MAPGDSTIGPVQDNINHKDLFYRCPAGTECSTEKLDKTIPGIFTLEKGSNLTLPAGVRLEDSSWDKPGQKKFTLNDQTFYIEFHGGDGNKGKGCGTVTTDSSIFSCGVVYGINEKKK